MVFHDKTGLRGHITLSLFYRTIDKFKYLATFDAHHVVVVRPVVEFIQRSSAFEVMADKQAGGLELGQDAINRCKPNLLLTLE